jgi:hypothetical protein
VSPVKYELGVYIPEGDILQSATTSDTSIKTVLPLTCVVLVSARQRSLRLLMLSLSLASVRARACVSNA